LEEGKMMRRRAERKRQLELFEWMRERRVGFLLRSEREKDAH
jgi:hypothetical protein